MKRRREDGSIACIRSGVKISSFLVFICIICTFLSSDGGIDEIQLMSSFLADWSLVTRNTLNVHSLHREPRKYIYNPIEFRSSPNDTEWHQLEAMRWERSEDSEESTKLLMKRKNLLLRMIKNSARLRTLWEEELSQLAPRGVVMSAGTQEQLTNAFASMFVLRNVTESFLPIALCHYGEASEESQAFIKQHIKKVQFIDMSEFPYPEYHLEVFDGHPRPRSREDGYMVKILALRAAPFKEIVFVDVDSFPLEDPNKLFRLSQYVDHGSVFWPDVWRGKTELYEFFDIAKDSPWYKDGDIAEWRERVGKHYDVEEGTWDVDGLNTEPVTENQAEAGQLLFNREKHWDVLEILLLLNMHHNITYHVPGTLGDKDTFRVAFALAGKVREYYQVPIGPLFGMVDFEKHGVPDNKPRYRTLGNVQLHPKGHMVFHHKTVEKLPATGDPGYRVCPIDLVTTPLSEEQGTNMMFGGSEWRSLDKGWFQWGFLEYDIKYFVCGFNCTCSLSEMHKVDKICTGRTEQQKNLFDFAFPVTAVKVPEGHPARKGSAALALAYDLLPPEGI